MVKKFVLLIFTFFISSFAQAQKDTLVHPAKLSFIGEEIFFPQKSLISFGFQFEVPLGRHLYLNYHFSMGTTSQRGFYGHATLGGAGGAFLVTEAIGEKGIGWLALILCFVPEGIGYRIPLGKKIELVPYFNPLQADYRTFRDSNDEEFNFSGDAGCRYVIKLPKFYFFQIHLGSKLLYNNGEWGLEGGASIGKYF